MFGLSEAELERTAKLFSEAAIPSLNRCVNDPERSIRYRAVWSLVMMGERPTNALPFLILDLNDTDPGRRREVVNLLRFFGKEGSPAIPALLQALDDPDEKVRRWALKALEQIDPTTAQRVTPPQPVPHAP
jgi:HEAT repeat protein